MIKGAIFNAAPTPTKVETRVKRENVDPQMREAAEGMEKMFLDYMMQVMRNTVPENEMDLEGPATKIYRSMMDSETTKQAVKSGGIGLADQIIAYLESARYNQMRRTESPHDISGTGGTDESLTKRK